MTMRHTERACQPQCLWRLVLLVFLLLGGTACDRDNTYKANLYVYPDPTGKNALFVNEQPVETFQKERGSGPESTNIYESYYYVKSLDPRFHVVIKAGEVPLYETSVEPGKYVVNLSGTEDIWFAEIAYGRKLERETQFLDRGKLGVYRLGTRPYGVVFRFDQEPPETIRTRRGGGGTEYFVLGTHTEKGMALRKHLAGVSQKKNKAEYEERVMQEALEGIRNKKGALIDGMIGKPDENTRPK